MSTLETAIRVAAEAHAGVLDRQNQPYILHAIRVMMGVDDPEARVVAVLHDVVEDTPVTLDRLRDHGFAEHILTSVDAVTHRDGESYADYVVRCKSDPVGRQVKLSDLRDNSRIDRSTIAAGHMMKYGKRSQK